MKKDQNFSRSGKGNPLLLDPLNVEKGKNSYHRRRQVLKSYNKKINQGITVGSIIPEDFDEQIAKTNLEGKRLSNFGKPANLN